MATEKTQDIIRQITQRYDASVERLRTALAAYLKDRTAPNAVDRANGAFAYPELVIRYDGVEKSSGSNLAFGRLEKPGTYRITLTRPEIFGDYLESQIELLVEQFEIQMEVHAGRQEIPFPYVLDGLDLGDVSPTELSKYFPATELAHIGDEAADGLLIADANGLPLSLFDGLRTDFSLARLKHYTGTPPEHFQRYILFTNYNRYVDEFVAWACQQVGKGRYLSLIHI